MKIRFPIFLFWIILSMPVWAAQPVELSSEAEYKIGKQVSWYEDPSATLRLKDVMAKNGFVASTQENLAFGLTRSAYWIKVILKNESFFNDWLLLVDFPQNSLVEIYNPGVSLDEPVFRTGFLLPFAERPVSASVFAFPLDFRDNEQGTLYVRVVSDRTMIIPLSVIREPVFLEKESAGNLGYGIYFGIMIGLMLYNLFLFFGLRDKAYLYYVFFLGCSVLLFASISGKSFEFLLPAHPLANRLLIEISSALLAFFSAHFAIIFLRIKEDSLLLFKLLQGVKVLAIISLILIFTIDIMIVQPLLYIMLTLDILILLASGIVSWRKKNAYAGYFVIAWLGYMIGGILTMGRDQGLPLNFITNHGAEIGSALEAVLLSLALSKKYQIYRREKEEAIRRSLEIQQEANETLEKKVEERTVELRDANLRLNETFRVVSDQKLEIEEKNRDITSSITYAQRIQNSILPTQDKIRKIIPDHFIFYRPMHIVSGDYYWMNESGENLVLVVADCTGHGVPGAFMSMIGSVLLNQIVIEKNETDPGSMLQQLDLGVRKLLKPKDSEIYDGMDVSVIVFNRKTKMLRYAGAMLPLYYIQFGELHEIKGSRFPVGGMLTGEERHYETHELKLDVSTLIYLSTDGYKDQFGGFKGRKFMASQFRNLLLANHHLPLPGQREQVEKANRDWMGTRHAQTDDILVFGLRLG